MASTPQPRYKFELYNNGVKTANITRLMQNISMSIPRNDTEDLSFDIDVDSFEQFCADAGINAATAIVPDISRIKVYRQGVFKFTVEVKEAPIDLDENSAKCSVKCKGMLDLFSQRFVTANYVQVDNSSIGWNLIVASQAKTTYHNYGVTKSAVHWYDTGILRDMTYADQNVKDNIKNRSEIAGSTFDFAFGENLEFETYQMIGEYKPNFPLIWPFNITKLSLPNSGSSIANYIIGKGSGVGDDTIISSLTEGVSFDTPSMTKFYARENIVTFNSIINQQPLDDNTAAELKKSKDILNLPKVNVTSSYLDNGIWRGDRIPLAIRNHPMIANIDGIYRIEQMDINLDDNLHEDATLTFDTYGLS